MPKQKSTNVLEFSSSSQFTHTQKYMYRLLLRLTVDSADWPQNRPAFSKHDIKKILNRQVRFRLMVKHLRTKNHTLKLLLASQ